MFRLDYVSCLLTILSTILIGRKMWGGLIVAGVNSLLIGFIGFKTHQIGFIPANAFCILVYGFSLRSWMYDSRVGRWLRDTRAAEAEDAAATRQLPGSGSVTPPVKNGKSAKGARIIPFPVGGRNRLRGRIANR